ncbi:MAG TPA: peptide-methionine (S)-S-oxide reductase MsrA [Candidatus Tumulicola sp.]|jgi:peptide-methionine (S)-S-oxide reductase
MKALFAVFLTAALLGAGPAPAPGASSQRVVLAGGCFWGMQLVFESLKGVRSAVAGYAGGAANTAHYDDVSTGTTGHAESVEVTYDPRTISFTQLLDVYFLVAHDPTERNRQGPDDGTQYRSEIFYTSAAQAREAGAYVAALETHHVFASPIVTKLAPLHGFYPAESYHQNYAIHNPDSPYIVINDLPKLHVLRQKYPSLVRANAPTG